MGDRFTLLIVTATANYLSVAVTGYVVLGVQSQSFRIELGTLYEGAPIVGVLASLSTAFCYAITLAASPSRRPRALFCSTLFFVLFYAYGFLQS